MSDNIRIILILLMMTFIEGCASSGTISPNVGIYKELPNGSYRISIYHAYGTHDSLDDFLTISAYTICSQEKHLGFVVNNKRYLVDDTYSPDIAAEIKCEGPVDIVLQEKIAQKVYKPLSLDKNRTGEKRVTQKDNAE